MSTTAHWEPIRPPDPPSGSLYRLKHLLFEDGWNRGTIGAERVVMRGDLNHGKLIGLHSALPSSGGLDGGEDREELGRILAAIEEHGGVRVWIDE